MGRSEDPIENDDRTFARGEAPTRSGTGEPAPDLVHQEYAPGDIIRGRFRLERMLGKGGMGTVFLATDLTKEKFEDREPHVAIKFLGGEFSTHPQARIALERETRNAQRLSHPNIVKVFDFDEHGHSVYMTMEFMRGTPLDEFMLEHAQNGMPFEKAWPIIRGMGLALAYVHSQGMVHSDFKPNNVFVEENGTAKLLDLGIARISEKANPGDRSTRFDPSALGALTPEYASCEMFEGLDADSRDDLYALGCVVYQLLTGRHPFDRMWAIKARKSAPPLQPVKGLSKRRWQALRRAVAFDREDRMPSADAFLEAFEDIRDFSRPKLAAAVVLSAVAAAGLVWSMIPGIDPDKAFINELLNDSGRQELSEADERNIDNWLRQGTAYTGFARDAFMDLDADSGHHDLLGGADNSASAFHNVLRLTPSREAAAGLLAVAETYAFGAERFADAGEGETALWLACQGLSVHEQHSGLRQLYGRLASDLTVSNSADVRQTCNGLAR
jgi:serine/threonine protein kinase